MIIDFQMILACSLFCVLCPPKDRVSTDDENLPLILFFQNG
jgi:hypothetical protein